MVQYVYPSAVDTLTCYDINDPTDIKFLSKRDSLGDTISIAIDGDKVYTGRYASSQTISTYNVSDASDLGGSGYYLDYVSVTGKVSDIEPEGHLVYYTVYDDSVDRSFRIIDARNPNGLIDFTPNWVSNKSLGLAVNGHLAYIASSTEGMYILNVSDKFTPVELGHVGLPGNATDVLLDGRFAYVTLGDAGFAVVDVFDPENPLVLAIVDVGGTTNHMALQGNTLFVTAGAEGVKVFDVVNPFRPIFVTNMGLPYTFDVELFGGILVVGSIDGIHTFQICAEGGGLTDLSNYIYENMYSDYEVWDVEVIGDIAYIAEGLDGLYTLNVRDPKNPILLDRWFDGSKIFKKLDINGQFAHCADTTYQYIFDISDPTNINFESFYTGADIIDVVNTGGITYITVGPNVGVGNSTLPTNIYVMDVEGVGSNLTAVCVEGRYLYVADYLGGSGEAFYVIDIMDPDNLEVIYSKDGTMAYHWDLYIDGDLLYAANGKWYHLWNVSDLTNVQMADYINYGVDDVTMGVHPFGLFSVNAKNFYGVAIVNNTTPINVFEIANYADATAATQVEIAGDFAYIANRSSLIIFRLFESAADTYIETPHLARSNSIFTMPNGSITSATLSVDEYLLQDTDIEYFISADGGANWESVIPGTPHAFTHLGTDLRWQAYFNGEKDRSPHLYQLEIVFDFEYGEPSTPPTTPTTPLSPLWIGIIGGGAGLLLIVVIVVVIVVVRKGKKVPTR